MNLFGDLLLALLLCTPSAERLAGCFPCQDWVRDQLRGAAVRQELLDGRYAHFWFAKPGDISNDMDLLRNRASRLWDAPSLKGLPQLTDDDVMALQRALYFQEEFRTRIQGYHDFYWSGARYEEAAVLREVLAELDFSRSIWIRYKTALDPQCDVVDRRERFRDLQEILGDRPFPPLVPVDRCRLLD